MSVASSTTREAVVDWLAERSQGWLAPLAGDQSLDEALAQRSPRWRSPPERSGRAGGAILYPLVYTDTPRVTAQQFCEITDAACEAQRAGTDVVLAGIPTGRARLTNDAGDRACLGRIVQAWEHRGYAVEAADAVHTLPAVATPLVERARRSAFRRRALDLADLLVAAAADAVGARRVYLGAHVQARRNLGDLESVAPLCRLYGSEPLTDPPAHAKLRPAGSDALWFLAFTLGLVGAERISSARQEVCQQVREAVAGVWNDLRAQSLTAHQAMARPAESLELRLTRLGGQPAAGAEAPVVVPLFGAPTLGASTRHFLTAVTTVIPAERVTLCVDDLTPRFLYRDPGDIGATYRSLAADLGCGLRLLSELDPDDLRERLATILARLSADDLARVVPRGTLARLRGGPTGYDAIHLAVIAACLQTGPQPGLIATKSANLAALHRLAHVTTATGALVCTGHDHASPGDTPRLVVEDAALLPTLRFTDS
ncbi:hypothetical protein RIF23_05960 [Lipingzhangella sp. LS1_29]|uniref:Uncharacterized protein n=1 Tax=Lipingzhangella rawalii TaxID=2055835 RepID=A0ABU2H4B1_9ACTN|nr:hypothetical protein [Lipingzhangella rawalii]MDS1269837.1 hypothetical protein [Lipingzhangella rawalii]